MLDNVCACVWEGEPDMGKLLRRCSWENDRITDAIPFSTPEAEFDTDFHAALGHIWTRSRTVPSVRVPFITGSAKQRLPVWQLRRRHIASRRNYVIHDEIDQTSCQCSRRDTLYAVLDYAKISRQRTR